MIPCGCVSQVSPRSEICDDEPGGVFGRPLLRTSLLVVGPPPSSTSEGASVELAPSKCPTCVSHSHPARGGGSPQPRASQPVRPPRGRLPRGGRSAAIASARPGDGRANGRRGSGSRRTANTAAPQYPLARGAMEDGGAARSTSFVDAPPRPGSAASMVSTMSGSKPRGRVRGGSARGGGGARRGWIMAGARSGPQRVVPYSAHVWRRDDRMSGRAGATSSTDPLGLPPNMDTPGRGRGSL